MAEWWQSPAYLERQAAGEVVTPGLVDWGGIANAFNAPYNERTGRLPDGPMPPRSGNTVTSYYNAGAGGLVAPKSDRYSPSMDDPLQLMSRVGYVPAPRFGTMPPTVAASPKVWQPNSIPGPTPVAKTQDRLAPTPVGLPPGYGSSYKATPRFSSASPLPPGQAMFGINLPTIKGTGTAKGYTATPRFSTARAGSDIIELDLDLGDRGAQGMADSEGKPVRTKSGKVYYPGGKAPATASRAAGAPDASSRSGGLFGGLFGGAGGLFGGGARSANGMVPGIGVATAAAAPAPGPAIYTPQGNVHPGSFYDNSGNDMAHMPKAYQDNPRNSNGGY
jgi:hypothetical protein